MGERIVDARPKQRTYKRPFKPGVLVTGRNSLGTMGPVQHQSHLFITGKVIPKEISNSGFYQAAHCIHCGVDLQPVDSEFYEVRATEEDVINCMKWMVQVIEQWDKVANFLESVVVPK